MARGKSPKPAASPVEVRNLNGELLRVEQAHPGTDRPGAAPARARQGAGAAHAARLKARGRA